MRRLAVVGMVWLCLWSSWSLEPARAQGRKTENVVLVTLDGARWQEIFTGLDAGLAQASAPRADVADLPIHRDFGADTAVERRRRLMPFLWNTLVAQRGFIAGDRRANSFVSVTNRHWFSYPGYSEILTGQAHDEDIKSNEAVRNPFPSVLQFVAQKLRVPASSVATFASWGVFNEIVESVPGSTFVNAGPRPYPLGAPDTDLLNTLQLEAGTPWANTRHDAYTFQFALDYLKRSHPRVLYIAFDETDDWAHDNRYDLVLRMLHRSDAYLERLWNTLEGDPQYRGKTTLIVATDHGRGRTATDWQKHGKDVPGADEIWIAIASPDSARRGLWRDGPALYQNQIAATIAAVLGLDYREQNPSAGTPIDLGGTR